MLTLITIIYAHYKDSKLYRGKLCTNSLWPLKGQDLKRIDTSERD